MTTKVSPVACLFETDAYKLDHRRQYSLAGNVTRVYSNYTARKSRMPGVDHTVHFGLQAYLQKHLMDAYEPFFDAPCKDVQRLYKERVTRVLGPAAADAIGTAHIEGLHKLGYLPLEFRAAPEGTLIPIRVPIFTVENTLDEFFWLTNYIETGNSCGYWQPSTSATIAHHHRQLLDKRAEITGGAPESVDFQLHDFSYRGMSSHESASSSGAGHLLSFKGSDTLCAGDFIEQYYGGPYDLMSVAATEHSVMSTGIAVKGGIGSGGEQILFSDLLKLYPSGILSVVSDTFNLWDVLTVILPALKAQVLSRDGKLVIRPDSGDPVKIICGNPMSSNPNEVAGVIDLLWETFGGTTNDKGYRELDPHIGAIYGDSITYDRAEEITAQLAFKGYASSNIVFGVGSFTYQYNTRDTFGSAMKATQAVVNGNEVDLFKDPITDDGTKKSATGRLAVLEGEKPGDFYLVEKASSWAMKESILQPTWRNGKFLQRQTFQEVRDVLNRK